MNARADDHDFDAQCRTVARLLRLQNDRPLGDGEEHELFTALSNVTRSLPKFLRRPPGDTRLELEDLAQEAMARFVKAATAGRILQSGSPAGYLMTIAMNVRNSELRKPLGPTPSPDPRADQADAARLPVDQTLALLDDLARRDSVREAMRRAQEAGDERAAAVVGAWLDLAHEEGKAPPIRAVAALAGVSHTSVVRCLNRFRMYLKEASTE